MERIDLLMAEYKEQCADWRMRDGYMEMKFTRSAFVFSVFGLAASVLFAEGIRSSNVSLQVAILGIFLVAFVYTFIMLISIYKDTYYRNGSMVAASTLLKCIEEHIVCEESGREDLVRQRLQNAEFEEGTIEMILAALSKHGEAERKDAPLPSDCLSTADFDSDKSEPKHFLRKLRPPKQFTRGWTQRLFHKRQTELWIKFFYSMVLALLFYAIFFVASQIAESKSSGIAETADQTLRSLDAELAGTQWVELGRGFISRREEGQSAYSVPVIRRLDDPPTVDLTHYIPAIVDENSIVHVLCRQSGGVVHSEPDSVPQTLEPEPTGGLVPIDSED